MRVREEIHGATEAQRYREVGPVGYRLLVHHAHSLLTPAPIKGAEQSHPAMLLPFSPLSFPRKRESSAPKPVTRPWIPACELVKESASSTVSGFFAAVVILGKGNG